MKNVEKLIFNILSSIERRHENELLQCVIY